MASRRRLVLLGIALAGGACVGKNASPTTTELSSTTEVASTTSSVASTTVPTTTTRVTIPGGEPLPPLPGGVGPLLIAESDMDRVLLIHPDGSKEVVLGGVPNPRGLGLSPDGVTLAVAAAGRAPGQGAVILVRADRQVTTVIDGLDHPEDVAFYGDDTLVFTGFTDGTINVIGVDGDGLRSIPIAGQPTGITYVEFFPVGWGMAGARNTMIVATWDQGLFDYDPATDEITDRGWSRERLAHLNEAAFWNLCVPSTSTDEVGCLTGDLGGTYRVKEPVDVAGTRNPPVMLFTGSEGLTIFDGYRYDQLGPLAHPAGLVILWRTAEEWLHADLSTYTPDQIFASPLDQAEAMRVLMLEIPGEARVETDSVDVDIHDDPCWPGVPSIDINMTVASGTPEQADAALAYLESLGLPTWNSTGPWPMIHTPLGDIGLEEDPPGFTLTAYTDCYWEHQP
jgi:hypothetical protein